MLDREHLGLMDIARRAQRLRAPDQQLRGRYRLRRAGRRAAARRYSSARRGSPSTAPAWRSSPRSTVMRWPRARARCWRSPFTASWATMTGCIACSWTGFAAERVAAEHSRAHGRRSAGCGADACAAADALPACSDRRAPAPAARCARAPASPDRARPRPRSAATPPRSPNRRLASSRYTDTATLIRKAIDLEGGRPRLTSS